VLVSGPLIGALIYSAVSRSLQISCGEAANGLPADTNGRSIGSIAATGEEVRAMGRQTGRNLRNRRRKQQIRKRLRQEAKQKSRARPAP
jgi:hypothetical protein